MHLRCNQWLVCARLHLIEFGYSGLSCIIGHTSMCLGGGGVDVWSGMDLTRHNSLL